MEENRKEGIFQSKKIVPKEEKNIVNLRQRAGAISDHQPEAFGEPLAAAEPRLASRVDKKTSASFGEKVPVTGKGRWSAMFSGNILDILLEYGVYLLIFLMPLFILPFSFEVFEFNKSFLLAFGAAVLFFFWILDSIFVKKRIHLAGSMLTLLFGSFIAVLFVSSFFSVDRASSFLGYSGNFSDSFAFYLGLFVFYLLFTSLAAVKGSERVVGRAVRALVHSALLVCLVSLPYYFGLEQLPLFGSALAGFNLVSGYYHIFAIYLLVMLFVVLYDLSLFSKSSVLRKSVDILTAVLILVNLIMIDWAMIYLVIFILSGALVLFGGALRKENLSSRAEYMVLVMMIVSSLMFVSSLNPNDVMNGKISIGSSSVSGFIKNTLDVKIANLDASVQNGFGSKAAIDIAQSSFVDRPVLGSGLGTYHYDFFKYKSADFNYDSNWSVGFNKAYNEMLEKVSTIGVAGLLSYLLFVLAALLLLVKNIKARKYNEFVLAAFLSLLVFQFLFFETAVIKFLFVVLIAIAAASRETAGVADSTLPQKKWNGVLAFDIDNKKISGGIVSFLGVAGILLCSISLILGFQLFRAEAAYREVAGSTTPENLDASKLDEVTRLNPYKGDYAAGISRIYMSRVYKLSAANQNDQDTLNKLTLEASSALAYARKAVELSPSSLYVWENYGVIYKSINDAGMKGGNDWAIKGYEEALKLNPNDPVLRTEIGKLYLVKYQEASKAKNEIEQQAALQKAKEYLQQAQELKNNYPDTALELALVYAYEGDKEKTLEQVDKASKMPGLSIQSAVEIGRMYYNAGEKDKARNALNQVVAIDANNADAHYMLGAMYKDDKKYSDALNEFNLVAKFNADNEALKRVISDVEALASGSKTDETATNAQSSEAAAGSGSGTSVSPITDIKANAGSPVTAPASTKTKK